MNRSLLLAAACTDVGRILSPTDPSSASIRFLKEIVRDERAAEILDAARNNRDDNDGKILVRAEQIGGGWGGTIDGFLKSPFASLDLGLKRVTEPPVQPIMPIGYSLDGQPLTEREGALEHYRPGIYTPQAAFPLPLDAPGADPAQLAAKFEAEARTAFAGNTDDRVILNRISALLLRYGWYLPVDSDRIVSVYDKSKITIAAAACLSSADGVGAADLLLVGGDISGIQAYLFDISDPGNREVARRLRARSFFLSKITDVFLHRVLAGQDLPEACTLFNSGGRFLLLTPNSDAARNTLRDVEAQLNLYLLHNMLGEISFQAGRFEVSDADLQKGKFRATLERLGAAIEERKARRFSAVLEGDTSWRTENFVLTDELFRRYQNGVCTLCHKLPAVTQTGECENCAQDAEAGRKLTESIGYRIRPQEGDLKYLTGDARMAIELHRERIESIRVLNPTEDELVGETDGFLFMNNHVPSVRDATKWRCRVHGEYECPTRSFIVANPDMREWPVAVECLAGNGAHRIDTPPDVEQPPGVKYIGVLKADVDRLGMLFSLGMRDKLSLPNYSLLSRLVDLFFSGYTRTLQRRTTIDYGPYRFDPGEIYTVFAGGDDLLFIGSWDVIALFAGLIYKRFKRFTGNHPEIALSAGIAIGKPETPLAVLVEEAEEALEASKDGGRDRLTLFDTTIRWRDFDDLMIYSQLFDIEIMKNKANVPGATLNQQHLRRIQAYGKLCDDAMSGRDTGGVIWIPRFLRYIEKRIMQKDRHGNVLNQPVVGWMRMLFKRRDLMSRMRIPTQWAMYRNRRGWE